jgi:gentisate 1,2-dioxygenase
VSGYPAGALDQGDDRVTVQETPERRDYYARLGARHVLPLWVDTHRYVPMAPAPNYVLALWR